jgi:hypothetical protein
MLKRLAEQPPLEPSNGSKSRVSRRQLDADMERHKTELQKLQGEDDWMFDCSVCGVHGQNWVRYALHLANRLTLYRTMARTVSHARNAVFGSTARATASRSKRPRRRSSTSYAGHASSRPRTQAQPLWSSRDSSRQSNRRGSVEGRERFPPQSQSRKCRRLDARRKWSRSTTWTTWVLQAAVYSVELPCRRRRRRDRLWSTKGHLTSLQPSPVTTPRPNTTLPHHPRRRRPTTTTPTT